MLIDVWHGVVDSTLGFHSGRSRFDSPPKPECTSIFFLFVPFASVVYFDQLSGAARTQKLVEKLFWGSVSKNNHYICLKIGMLDLIIISLKLTTNASSYLQEYIKYPVYNTYNNRSL